MTPRILLTSATLILAAGAAQAQTLGFSTSVYSSAAGARDAVAVDLNSDGWPGSRRPPTPGETRSRSCMNRGDGTGFGPPQEIAVGAGPFDIDAGDLNGDAHPGSGGDHAGRARDRGAVVRDRRASGCRGPRWPLAARRGARRSSDVTRDGSSTCLHRLRAQPGRAAARKRRRRVCSLRAEWVVGARPQGVAAADFNHDGLVDLAVASTGATALDVLYGAPAGGFTRRRSRAGRTLNVLSRRGPERRWLARHRRRRDLNKRRRHCSREARPVSPRRAPCGRGFASRHRVRRLQPGRPARPRRQQLRQRHGHGAARPARWFGPSRRLGDLPSGSGARGVAAADFNHDGRLDLAAGAQSAARISLHENVTQFVAPALSFSRQATGLYYAPSAVADFNENGKPDLVTERHAAARQRHAGAAAAGHRQYHHYRGRRGLHAGRTSGCADSQSRPSTAPAGPTPRGCSSSPATAKAGFGPPHHRGACRVASTASGPADLDKDGHLDMLAFTLRRSGPRPRA